MPPPIHLTISITLLTLTLIPHLTLAFAKPLNGAVLLNSTSGLVATSSAFNFTRTTSFYSNFTFAGDDVALVIVPSDYETTFALASEKLDDLSTKLFAVRFVELGGGNVCEFVVDGVRDVRGINVDLSSGVELFVSVDYRAVLRKIEVRIGELGGKRAEDVAVSYPVDLGGMWRGEGVRLGLVLSSKGSSQVYSLSTVVENVPKWLHSVPLNPRDHVNESGEGNASNVEKACAILRFLLFAVGCGSLAAFVFLLLWKVFVDKETKNGGDRPVCAKEFRYEKVNVLVEIGSGGLKK